MPLLDIVLIGAHNIGYTLNETELAFVQKRFQECTVFLIICSGVFVPIAAGLLEGKIAIGPVIISTALSQSVGEIFHEILTIMFHQAFFEVGL